MRASRAGFHQTHEPSSWISVFLAVLTITELVLVVAFRFVGDDAIVTSCQGDASKCSSVLCQLDGVGTLGLTRCPMSPMLGYGNILLWSSLS